MGTRTRHTELNQVELTGCRSVFPQRTSSMYIPCTSLFIPIGRCTSALSGLGSAYVSMSPCSQLCEEHNKILISTVHHSTNRQSTGQYGRWPIQRTGYLSTVSPLLRRGASIRDTVGYVFMPGTPRRTLVGGVFAWAPWTQELRRSVEQPSSEFSPFQQIGKMPPPKEKPLLKQKKVCACAQ